MKKIISISITLFVLTSISTVYAQNVLEVYERSIIKGRDCPCRVKLKSNGYVVLVDRRGQILNTYSSATSRSNRQVYQSSDKFWILRSNKWVFVYDLNTGFQESSYYAPDLRNWVR